MAPAPRIWRDKVSEGGTKFHRARLTDRNGNVLTQSDFTGSITRQVYDLNATNIDVAVLSNTSSIASLVYNALQSWDDDAKGYNFEASVTSNQLTWEGGHTYRACYSLNRASASGEGVLTVIFENKVEVQYGT